MALSIMHPRQLDQRLIYPLAVFSLVQHLKKLLDLHLKTFQSPIGIGRQVGDHDFRRGVLWVFKTAHQVLMIKPERLVIRVCIQSALNKFELCSWLGSVNFATACLYIYTRLCRPTFLEKVFPFQTTGLALIQKPRNEFTSTVPSREIRQVRFNHPRRIFKFILREDYSLLLVF